MKPTKKQVLEWAREAQCIDPMVFAIAYERFAAIAYAAGQASKSEWRDIETAPKDGTIVLLSGEFDYPGDWRIKMGYWAAYEKEWHLFGGVWKPTHWMPLPEAPSQETSE